MRTATIEATPTTRRRRATNVKVTSDDTRRHVGGVPVASEEPVLSNLPQSEGRDPIIFRGFTLLRLDDGTSTYSCSQCDHTGTRGAILKHRARQHGASLGGRRKGVDYSSGAAPPAARRKAEMDAALALTIGEVIEMGMQLNSLAVIVETLTAERDDLRTRLVASEQENRKFRLAFDKLGFIPREDGGE